MSEMEYLILGCLTNERFYKYFYARIVKNFYIDFTALKMFFT